MFKVNTSLGMMDVSFKYDTVRNRRVVTAHIRCGNVDISGVSMCADKDNFSRVTGRKIALTRALERNVLDKPDRKAIWDAYFAVHSDLKK